MPERRTSKKLKSSRHRLSRLGKSSAAKKTTAKKSAGLKKAAPAKAAPSAKEASLSVYDLNGKTQETLALDPLFGGGKVNSDVIYQAVLMYQAGQREGTAATKDRGHVRGGGKKPWKQKGTGRARHASIRSPIWRGGGTTFGPMPRDYSYSLSSQLKRRAVVETMKDKVAGGKLLIMKELDLKTPKTGQITDILDTFKLKKPLFLVDQKNDNLRLATRNIRHLSVKTATEVNALDVVLHKECVITKTAYTELLKRLKK